MLYIHARYTYILYYISCTAYYVLFVYLLDYVFYVKYYLLYTIFAVVLGEPGRPEILPKQQWAPPLGSIDLQHSHGKKKPRKSSDRPRRHAEEERKLCSLLAPSRGNLGMSPENTLGFRFQSLQMENASAI